jgi:phage shock protein B|uniref:envelope stress response membrane protein PspB n=1 Tax=Sphingomonas sp. TaxID=28214 RepID=UPI0025F85CE2|nr:envelope stress response membrane protein PspB [Sphingomonas sp.]
MEDFFTIAVPITSIFIALPWLILHYVTKWKTAPKITQEDEGLLDELYSLSRRLEDRLTTVERIVAADNPDWKPGPSHISGPSAQSDDYLSRRN